MWYFNSSNSKRVLISMMALLLTMGLTACGNGGGGKGSSNPPTQPPIQPPTQPPVTPPYEATAFVGNWKKLPEQVANSVLYMGHAYTATYVTDENGVEKLVFYFEDVEGESTPGAELAGIDSTDYLLTVYIPEENTVCVKFPDFYEHTAPVVGDIESDAITFKYCADDVIQAKALADDWVPVNTEYFQAQAVFNTMSDDGKGGLTFNVSASVDFDGNVVLYTSMPEVASYEAIYSEKLNAVCINFISTFDFWSFEARVNGVATTNYGTDGLETYLGDDLVIDKVLFLIGCSYDLEELTGDNK